MEQGEQDLEKLARWLKKIQAWDFFPDERRQESFAMMARCRDALEGFSDAVYVAEGVRETAADGSRPTRRRTPPPTPGVGGPPGTQKGTRGATESPG
jgi:hypothetical protein